MKAADSSRTRESTRLPELDSLRGIAALAVVVFHWSTYYDARYGHTAEMPLRFPWGSYGVHLFFIISGFVITMTLERTPTALSFLRARFFRLYPTFWAGVAIGAASAWWNRPDLRQPLGIILCTLTMIPTFLGLPHVDGVYWTLEIEFVFYIAMAVFTATGTLSAHRLRQIFLAWIALAVTWYFVLALLTHQDPAGIQWGFDHPRLQLLTTAIIGRYIGLFAIGTQLYGLSRGAKAEWKTYVVFGLGIVNQFLWGRRGGLAACMGATLLVYWAAFHRPRWLRLRPLLLAGALSYPIYLIHQNLGFAIIRTGYAHQIHPYVSIAFASGVVFALTFAMRRWVEQPAIALGKALRSQSGERKAPPPTPHETGTDDSAIP